MIGHPTVDAGELTLRRHQVEALTALDEAWAAGRDRAWVVLPPGAGKTLVGLVPAARVTVLTYQSLAIFDADEEVTDDGEEGPLLSRLHENGRDLVGALREAGPILLVLDECHHLLEVWGRLLAEVLVELPQAHVLGLTATPPAALTTPQAALVDSLFGGTVYEASIPAVVREGDLAPFAELAWLTTPTEVESRWLREEAVRFHELVHQLTDPGFGSIPFLEWLDRRFVTTVGDGVAWSSLVKQHPALCAAALRMHHAGLLALPTGSRMLEEHRHDPTADDWVVLLDGVLDQQEGSAHAVLAALLADPLAARLSPLLVTGRTVAGARRRSASWWT